MKGQTEIWKPHPDIEKIEVSSLGRVRTLDKIVPSSWNATRLVKGRILKQHVSKSKGYSYVGFRVDGKIVTKSVHRLVAQTFIPNPDSLPEINHLDCNKTNNSVDNLEWVTHEDNITYREKYGTPAKDFIRKSPVYAINLATLESLHFCSQQEAGRILGVSQGNIYSVIRGERKQANGYWFKADDGNNIKIDKDRLNDIVNGMRFRGGIFAVNLNTLEVSRFKSQIEAERKLGVDNRNINAVTKGKRNQTGGYWFVNDDENAVNIAKQKLYNLGKTKLTAADTASAEFVSMVNAE